MKTDNLFYYIFLNFPQFFFELINKEDTNINDYEFTSREIKQLSFRLDGLFLPVDNNSKNPFYLVEVQFQADNNFYYRLFAEFFIFLKQYQPAHPWQIVVIYPYRNRERIPNYHFEEMLNLNQVKRIYLDELSSNTLGVNTVKLIIESDNEAIDKAKNLISQAKIELTDSLIQEDFISLIETIIVYKLPHKTKKELEAMLGLDSIKKTKVYQEAFEEGKQEGKIDLISTLINKGFSVTQIAEMFDLPLDFIENLIKENE